MQRPKTRGSGLKRLSPSAVVVGSFAALILIGTLLLWAPFSHAPGRVGFLDALFTSTSAVCVTGLVVVDTGSRDASPYRRGIVRG